MRAARTARSDDAERAGPITDAAGETGRDTDPQIA